MPALTTAASVYIGIDPGASGGMATISQGQVKAIPMPATERDIWDAVLAMSGSITDRLPRHAVIERVSGYAGSGQPGSAMFKFGYNFGLCCMALTAAGIPWELVGSAAVWRACSVSPRRNGEPRTAWKNRLKARAQSLFPTQKVTLATADCLLMVEYCRRKHEGTLTR